MIKVFIRALVLSVIAISPAYAEKKPEPKEMTEANFVKLSPILMSVLQDRRIAGLVQIEVTLKLANASEWEAIVNERRRVKDKFVQAVGGMTRGAIRVDAPMNIALITNVLQRQADSVLGSDRVEVLVTDASTRQQ